MSREQIKVENATTLAPSQRQQALDDHRQDGRSAVHSPSTATSSTLGNSSPIRPSRSSELASSLARASFKLNATQFHALSGDFTRSSLRIISINTIQLLQVHMEDGMSCGMAEISELHDWVDGLLTPALAEVKFSYRTTNELVSKILDVHLYLCDSLAKAASILSIYRSVLGHRLASSQPAQPSQAEQPVGLVFITQSGEWKLSGFEVLSSPKVPQPILYNLPVPNNAGASHRRSSWARRLASANPKRKLKAEAFWEIGFGSGEGGGGVAGAFFRENRLIKVCNSLEGFSMASQGERASLVKSIKD
ncbi:hypothetical protein PGT21_001393 [Puccinia graminis f. sp. tritici]|uniref:Uncharacterized protein n=1 Tax=Puccinia graminis f. sp. tritici TaxID=56615 RepID=A0A5B0RCE5_PUCGR|nr:hypothetical protein PGT21_001393 [Puccinia graminis f. sp. tritici]KAA1123416.1 hypothetical protein PGTUg99_021739 [Puccinia graminis f. sp. tritici]